jgi:hypothetical protein
VASTLSRSSPTEVADRVYAVPLIGATAFAIGGAFGAEILLHPADRFRSMRLNAGTLARRLTWLPTTTDLRTAISYLCWAVFA